SPVLPADPAADLVRVRLFLATTASALDLAIDGALVANAVFTLRSGLPAVRMDLDRNTLHLTRNVQGASFDGQIDLILAAVPPRASVGWSLSAAEPSSARLEVRNVNAASTPVDTFDLDGVSVRFSTGTDLLRRGGPLGPVPP